MLHNIIIKTSIILNDSSRYEAPVHWLKNKYFTCEELFPHWKTARPILTDFVNKINFQWNIIHFQDDPSRMDVGFTFPVVRDELSGRKIGMHEMFPPEVRQKVIGICLELMKDYSVNLGDYLGELKCKQLEEGLLSDLKAREDFILRHGGYKAKDELMVRFGLCRNIFDESPWNYREEIK